jgi:hypothetical protein
MTARRRRWFRFSLRTLFVVVTVVGAVSAYIVHERRLVQQRARMVDSLLSPLDFGGPYDAEYGISVCDLTRDGVPFFRKALGDFRAIHLYLPRGAGQRVAQEYAEAFPEAEIEPHPADRP